MKRPSEQIQAQSITLLVSNGWSLKEIYRQWLQCWGHEAPRDATVAELRRLWQLVIRVQGEA
jgi:hypothetical protein